MPGHSNDCLLLGQGHTTLDRLRERIQCCGNLPIRRVSIFLFDFPFSVNLMYMFVCFPSPDPQVAVKLMEEAKIREQEAIIAKQKPESMHDG